MLNFSADFWPIFWTILSAGALLTIAVCFAVGVVAAPRTGRRQPPVRLHWHRPAQPLPPASDLPRAA